MDALGRLLLFVGLGLMLVGGLLLVASRTPGLRNLGSLPGDVRLQGESFACFFPIMSMCLLSLILTVVLNVVARLFAK